jgi:hypothetical protein
MGGTLPVKYSEYFGAKRHGSLKNENIRYDTNDIFNVKRNWYKLVSGRKSTVLSLPLQ